MIEKPLYERNSVYTFIQGGTLKVHRSTWCPNLSKLQWRSPFNLTNFCLLEINIEIQTFTSVILEFTSVMLEFTSVVRIYKWNRKH